jgi:hypothetical protein
MHDHFNELYEWDEDGNKRRKKRVARDRERITFATISDQAFGFRPTFADGSLDHTSPHRPGHRVADTYDEARIAANDAYEQRRERMANAWRNKGYPQLEDDGGERDYCTRTLDESRAAADAAYQAKRERLQNGWRSR